MWIRVSSWTFHNLILWACPPAAKRLESVFEKDNTEGRSSGNPNIVLSLSVCDTLVWNEFVFLIRINVSWLDARYFPSINYAWQGDATLVEQHSRIIPLPHRSSMIWITPWFILNTKCDLEGENARSDTVLAPDLPGQSVVFGQGGVRFFQQDTVLCLHSTHNFRSLDLEQMGRSSQLSSWRAFRQSWRRRRNSSEMLMAAGEHCRMHQLQRFACAEL